MIKKAKSSGVPGLSSHTRTRQTSESTVHAFRAAATAWGTSPCHGKVAVGTLGPRAAAGGEGRRAVRRGSGYFSH